MWCRYDVKYVFNRFLDLTVGCVIGQLSVYYRAALSATWRKVNLDSILGTTTMNTCAIQSNPTTLQQIDFVKLLLLLHFC